MPGARDRDPRLPRPHVRLERLRRLQVELLLGVGKGTKRKALRAKLKGEKCRTFTRPKRISICWLGSMTPSKPLTEFRIDSKGRVNNVRVAIVID